MVVLPTDGAWLAAKGDLPACWPVRWAAGEGTLRGAGEVNWPSCGCDGVVAFEWEVFRGCLEPCVLDGVGVVMVEDGYTSSKDSLVDDCDLFTGALLGRKCMCSMHVRPDLRGVKRACRGACEAFSRCKRVNDLEGSYPREEVRSSSFRRLFSASDREADDATLVLTTWIMK